MGKISNEQLLRLVKVGRISEDEMKEIKGELYEHN
jgi:hypothetical protein